MNVYIFTSLRKFQKNRSVLKPSLEGKKYQLKFSAFQTENKMPLFRSKYRKTAFTRSPAEENELAVRAAVPEVSAEGPRVRAQCSGPSHSRASAGWKGRAKSGEGDRRNGHVGRGSEDRTDGPVGFDRLGSCSAWQGQTSRPPPPPPGSGSSRGRRGRRGPAP